MYKKLIVILLFVFMLNAQAFEAPVYEVETDNTMRKIEK